MHDTFWLLLTSEMKRTVPDTISNDNTSSKKPRFCIFVPKMTQSKEIPFKLCSARAKMSLYSSSPDDDATSTPLNQTQMITDLGKNFLYQSPMFNPTSDEELNLVWEQQLNKFKQNNDCRLIYK